MRRVLVPSLGAVALVGGLAVALVVAPCAPPFAALAGFGFGPARCAGPRAAEAPRAVAPPTVTVVAAVDRPFVDRLFVSGSLVAREEAQVAAQIDGLTIVEIDAEEGDCRRRRPVARAARSQPDRRPDRPERRGDGARRRGDRSGQERDRTGPGAAFVGQRRLRPRRQARPAGHRRGDDRATRDGFAHRSRPARLGSERALGRRSRPQIARRRAPRARGQAR